MEIIPSFRGIGTGEQEAFAKFSAAPYCGPIMVMTYLWIAVGSALGGMARYAISLAGAQAWGNEFPWRTLGINIAGSLVIGLFFALTMPGGAYPATASMKLFVMTGLCGGFTTFSAFSLQSLQLLREGQYLPALGYMLGSVMACVGAAALGFWIGQRFGADQVAPL